MRMMVVKAIENRVTREVVVNPAKIETMDSSEGMSRIVLESGRTIYTETALKPLYNSWMMSLNPEMEIGYSEGVADARAYMEQQQAQEAQKGNETEAGE